MLVLTRHAGEVIHVGHNIKIHIVKISQTTVRVGIEAPPGVNVVRGELLTQKEPVNERD